MQATGKEGKGGRIEAEQPSSRNAGKGDTLPSQAPTRKITISTLKNNNNFQGTL